jgi:hypothetical protein
MLQKYKSRAGNAFRVDPSHSGAETLREGRFSRTKISHQGNHPSRLGSKAKNLAQSDGLFVTVQGECYGWKTHYCN